MTIGTDLILLNLILVYLIVVDLIVVPVYSHLTRFAFTHSAPQTELKAKLKENKELARQYRRQQQVHLKLKESLLDGLEGRITLEASLKDHKQVRD